MPHTPEQKRAHRLNPAVKERARQKRHEHYLKNREAILAKAKTPEGRAKGRDKKRRWYAKPENRAKSSARSRKYRLTHPESSERRRARELKKRHSERAFLAGRPRPTVCDSCGRADDRIVFDHCHQRGHFRGWLCDRCNRVLGVVRDDANVLRKLIAYLKRTSNGVSRQMSLPGI